MKTKVLMANAILLSVSGMLAKVFSAVYRIGLTRILGGVGIGLYQLIFPVYSLCVVLSTAGLPMAISKVIAKYKGFEDVVIKKCLTFAVISSTVLCFLLLCFGKSLAVMQGQPELTICYILLAPTLIVLSISSVFRGYFQGLGNFKPSAVSSLLEQFIKLLLGLIISLYLLKFGVIYAIIGAVLSIVLSEIVTLIVLFLYFKKHKTQTKGSAEVHYKGLVQDILPITLTNIILPLAAFIDSIMVVNLLSVNFSRDVAVFLYGLETGAVSSFVGLPTVFSFALASVILPALTNSKENNKKEKLTLMVKIVILLCVPCVLAFIFIPERLIYFLYGNRLNVEGLNGIKISSLLLSISGVGVLFLSLSQICSSALQAINKKTVTIRNLIIGVIIKFVIQLLFLSNKYLNIYILAYANTACYLTVFLLNYLEIKKYLNIQINFEFISKLIISNCLMLLILLQILSISKSAIITMVGVFFSVIIYFLSLIIFDIFKIKENKKIKYKIK